MLNNHKQFLAWRRQVFVRNPHRDLNVLYTGLKVMSAKRVGSYFVLMRQWGMVKLSRPKEIHHAPF
jgi:hypothetical protein